MELHDTPLTFVFTDIVGSTAMWQRNRNEMRDALEIHDGIVRRSVEEHGGRVFAGGGDGFGVVFADPSSAVDAAVAIQGSLEGLQVEGEPMRVRIGVHTGLAQERDGDYFGLTVNRAARLASAANGGQILVSRASLEHLDVSVPTLHLGQYHLADLLEPMDIHQVGFHEFSRVRALDPGRHNLPERYTSLIGRDRLIEEVSGALLRDRLVTLVGPGGIGKTSLASECGARISAASDSEVWLAELDQFVSGDDIEPAIASLFRLEHADGWERKAANRDAVLILDNAEHLIDAAADAAARLLRAGRQLRILATSREPLQIPGERVFDVPPLSLDGDAAHLLLDRSGDAFAPDELVSELVAATDGIPLALELVAAHVGRVPIEALVMSLRDHGISSLSVRGVAGRHRTTGAAIQWSYDLLASEERQVFRSLAAFSRDFSVKGAVFVSGGSSSSIVSLAERSLIHRVGSRFRMLAPVREFALDRLDEEDERADITDRFVDLVLAEIVEISRRLKPRGGMAWGEALPFDPDDVIFAAAWLIEREDAARLATLYLGLPGPFGAQRGRLERALSVLEPGLELLFVDPVGCRWAIYRHAWCLDLTGSESDALELIDRLLPIAAASGDEYLVAACAALRMRALSVDPEVPPGELEHLAETASSFREMSDWWEPEGMLFSRAFHAMAREDFERARSLFEATLSGIGRSDLTQSTFNGVMATIHLAECDRMLGEPEIALARLDAIGDVPEALKAGWEQSRAHTLVELGRVEEAHTAIVRMAALDIEQSGEETSESFCAAADYFRAVGDHRTAVLLLANMLDGQKPSAFTHRRVIEEGSEALGTEFDSVWERGRAMTAVSLHALLREDS